MWDIVTGRNGFEFPFSGDHSKVMEHLRSNRIEYVLIDKKKTPVKMFLAPVLLAYPSEFELVMEAKRASLYKVLNPP